MIGHFTIYNIRNHHLIGLFFILIAVVSFIPEDTLETQTGVTFFALFYGLYSISYSIDQRSRRSKVKGWSTEFPTNIPWTYTVTEFVEVKVLPLQKISLCSLN